MRDIEDNLELVDDKDLVTVVDVSSLDSVCEEAEDVV